MALTPPSMERNLKGMDERRVVIVTFPQLQSLDAVGPFEVFAGARQAAQAFHRAGGYQVTMVSLDGQPVRCESGLQLCTTPVADAPETMDTLVIPGGNGVHAASECQALVSWIAAAADRCQRVATVCSGAFLAARAGLLDGAG